MPRILAFDVNETLLDLGALDPLFERAFGDAAVRPQWFAQMLQVAFVGMITGRDVDFTTAQHGALRMVAERTGTELSDAAGGRDRRRDADAAAAPRRGARARPPARGRADAVLADELVARGLAGAARARGHRRPLRGDPVRRPGAGGSSPRPSPTGSWPTRSTSPIGDVRLIAAHAWDCAGALAAGAKAAFVARPGMVLSPVGEQPDIVGGDLDEVASLILA